MVGVVHGETSSGVGQPLEEIGKLVREQGKIFLVDTVCSLGGANIPVDDYLIDICYSGGQKCIGGPAGISCITLNDRAQEVIQGRSTPVDTWYLDLMMIKKYWFSDRVYHHTAPGPMIFALKEALTMIEEEGLEARVARHKKVGDLLKKGLEGSGAGALRRPGQPPLHAHLCHDPGWLRRRNRPGSAAEGFRDRDRRRIRPPEGEGLAGRPHGVQRHRTKRPLPPGGSAGDPGTVEEAGGWTTGGGRSEGACRRKTGGRPGGRPPRPSSGSGA